MRHHGPFHPDPALCRRIADERAVVPDKRYKVSLRSARSDLRTYDVVSLGCQPLIADEVPGLSRVPKVGEPSDPWHPDVRVAKVEVVPTPVTRRHALVTVHYAPLSEGAAGRVGSAAVGSGGACGPTPLRRWPTPERAGAVTDDRANDAVESWPRYTLYPKPRWWRRRAVAVAGVLLIGCLMPAHAGWWLSYTLAAAWGLVWRLTCEALDRPTKPPSP